MVLKRFLLITCGTLLISVSQSSWLNFPMPFDGSLVVAQTTDARKAEAQRLFNQGIEQLKASQFQAALQSWQQALNIYREIKDSQAEGAVLSNLGLTYIYQGDSAKAIEYCQQSLEIARQIKNRQSEYQALNNLGLAYNDLGDSAKAIEYYQQSLAIARQIKDSQAEEGSVLGNLGRAYNGLGDYAKAIEYYQQSLAIARQIKNPESEGKTLGNLGNTYINLGDYVKAIDALQQSLRILGQIKDLASQGKALNNLGNAYRSQGDYAKAIECYQQSLRISHQIKNLASQGKALNNLGNAYNGLGNYAKAIENYQQSLRIARQIKDPQSEGLELGNMGSAYSLLGDYVKAIDNYQQSLKIARQIKDPQSEGIALNNLGVALQKSGKLPEAEKILFEGIMVWESQRWRLGSNDAFKVSIFEEQIRTYSTLQKVLIAQHKTDTALEIAERGRARAFLELLSSRFKSQVKLPIPKIQEIKQIAQAQSSTLVQYTIIYDDFKVAGKQQNKESELYIWIVKPTGEVTFRKADLKSLWQKQKTSLRDLVTATRESIGVDDRSILGRDISRSFDEYNRSIFDQKVIAVNEDDQAKSLQQLHQLLITPIADILPPDPNQRVIFVPQGELFLVPFPALRDKQGKYLIEQHTILTSPSIQVLELTRQQREKVKHAAAKDAIVVGNPTMPSVEPKHGEKPKQLPALPGSEKEAQAIAPLLNTLALTGKAATKAAILARLPQAKIIHLATHGLFDNFQGLQSAVALAPSGTDNGLLTADEILNQKLNADLVVLSACNTGRGRITGDGVIGLSRALISAGTPSVIVSLWSVPDAPTAGLMTDFYTNLYKRKLDKAQSLRMAMLKFKDKDPKNWAAFTLIGEAE